MTEQAIDHESLKLNVRTKAWWTSAEMELKLYGSGLFIVALAVIAAIVSGPRYVVTGLSFAGGLALSLAFVLEAYAVGLKVWDTRPGKLLGALAATLIGAIAMGLSSVIVNEATGLDPAHFPYAVAFLAPWTAGYILLLATAVLSIVGLLVFMVHPLLLWMSKERAEGTKRFTDRILFRMLGWISLIMVTSTSWESGHQRYDSALNGAAGWFTFMLEMYGNDACAGEAERVRRLNDEFVAVGVMAQGSLQIEIKRCPIKLGLVKAEAL